MALVPAPSAVEPEGHGHVSSPEGLLGRECKGLCSWNSSLQTSPAPRDVGPCLQMLALGGLVAETRDAAEHPAAHGTAPQATVTQPLTSAG